MTSSHKYYDVLARDYDSVSNVREKYLRSVDDYLKTAIDCKKPRSLLDIGSGDGKRINKLTGNRNIDVWVLENSEVMSKMLTELFEPDRIINIDIQDLHDISKNFEMVTALWNVFGHISEIDDVFTQIKNKLTKDGVLVFDVNNPLDASEYGLISVIRNIWKLHVRKQNLSFNLVCGDVSTELFFRPLKKYQNLLKQAGFSRIVVCYVNYDSGKRTNRFRGQFYFECT